MSGPPPPPPPAPNAPLLKTPVVKAKIPGGLSHADLLSSATSVAKERLDTEHTVHEAPEAPEATDQVKEMMRLHEETAVECPRCGHKVAADTIASHADSHATKISEGLFLGNHFNARSKREVTRDGITRIVNAAVADHVKNWHEDESGKIVYHAVEIIDHRGSDIARHLDEAVTFIEASHRAGHRVLVHCVQGISRSSSIVTAYLIKHEGVSLREAITRVRALRPIARPNIGFFKQLCEFEVRHRGGEPSMSVDEYREMIGPELDESYNTQPGGASEVQMEVFDGPVERVEEAVGLEPPE